MFVAQIDFDAKIPLTFSTVKPINFSTCQIVDERLKKFKPTETVNQRYLSPILPKNEEREIVAVKSPMNTGKTEIVRVIKETLTKHGGIILGSRNSLLIQTGERIGVYHYRHLTA
jgi:hypothetical protein